MEHQFTTVASSCVMRRKVSVLHVLESHVVILLQKDGTSQLK